MFKNLGFVYSLCVSITFLIILFGCNKKELIVIVDGPTQVFKEYPESGVPDKNQVITIINKGENYEVVKTNYSKDFMFYKIKLNDGRVGYLWSGDDFHVKDKGGK